VRILALGVLNKAGTMFLNSNAHAFLHPAGIDKNILLDANNDIRASRGSSDYDRDLDGSSSYSRMLCRVLLSPLFMSLL
jgi:hypothetical protein